MGLNWEWKLILSKPQIAKMSPKESSIYSAELTAIDFPMNIIANHKSSKFIIYSDSKSVFLAQQNKDTSIPLITKLNKMNTISKNNSIILTWIPTTLLFMEVKGRQSYKKALLIDISKTKISYTDLNPTINKLIHYKWQKSWDKYATSSTVYKIPSVSGWQVIEKTEKWYSPDFALAKPTSPTHT